MTSQDDFKGTMLDHTTFFEIGGPNDDGYCDFVVFQSSCGTVMFSKKSEPIRAYSYDRGAKNCLRNPLTMKSYSFNCKVREVTPEEDEFMRGVHSRLESSVSWVHEVASKNTASVALGRFKPDLTFEENLAAIKESAVYEI